MPACCPGTLCNIKRKQKASSSDGRKTALIKMHTHTQSHHASVCNPRRRSSLTAAAAACAWGVGAWVCNTWIREKTASNTFLLFSLSLSSDLFMFLHYCLHCSCSLRACALPVVHAHFREALGHACRAAFNTPDYTRRGLTGVLMHL